MSPTSDIISQGSPVVPQGTQVLVLKGGPDAEREVSLRSGAMVADALRRAGIGVHEVAIDRPGLEELRAMPGQVVFPVLHGSWGEGGPLQELLEADGRPYVGSGPRAARIARSWSSEVGTKIGSVAKPGPRRRSSAPSAAHPSASSAARAHPARGLTGPPAPVARARPAFRAPPRRR